jgi:hypothetical protein
MTWRRLTQALHEIKFGVPGNEKDPISGVPDRTLISLMICSKEDADLW